MSYTGTCYHRIAATCMWYVFVMSSPTTGGAGITFPGHLSSRPSVRCPFVNT